MHRCSSRLSQHTDAFCCIFKINKVNTQHFVIEPGKWPCRRCCAPRTRTDVSLTQAAGSNNLGSARTHTQPLLHHLAGAVDPRCPRALETVPMAIVCARGPNERQLAGVHAVHLRPCQLNSHAVTPGNTCAAIEACGHFQRHDFRFNGMTRY